MPSPFALASIVTGLFVVGLVVAERKDHAPARALTKTLASVGFCAAGVSALPAATSFGRLMLAGLVLSLVGDVLLLSEKKAPFLAGMGAFAAAHVAYVAAFVVRGVAPFATEGALVLSVPAIAIVLGWLLPKAPSDMRAPVIGYAVVISAMVAAAVGTTVLHGGASITLGALMFYASDLSVARDRFVAPGFVNRAWGLPLYYAAQLVLAASSPGA